MSHIGQRLGLAQVRQLGQQQQADALEDVGGVLARDARARTGIEKIRFLYLSRRAAQASSFPPRRIRAPAARPARRARAAGCPRNGQRGLRSVRSEGAPLGPGRTAPSPRARRASPPSRRFTG